MMKLLISLFLLLLFTPLCMAQVKPATDAAFEEKLLKVLGPLQTRRLPDYLPGTEVTVQDYQDGKPYGPETKSVLIATPPGYADPYYAPLREALPTTLDEDDPANIFRPRPAQLQIDGHTVNCLFRAAPPITTSPMFDIKRIGFDGQGPTVSGLKRQWVLAANPKIMLREETVFVQWDQWFWHTTPLTWWAVTSIEAKKTVGDIEYECVETKHDFFFGIDGYSVITGYASLDVPNFWVEKETVFYQIGKDRKKNFHFVRTWKLLNIKLPARRFFSTT